MQCRKCKSPISNDDINTEVAAHNDYLLDIIITCPECGHKTNTFVEEVEFVDLDD